MWNVESQTYRQKRMGMVVARGWGWRGKGDMLFKGISLQLVDKQVTEI